MKSTRQQGMALVIVLWLVAALMVFVAGLGVVVKNEVKTVSIARELVTARAVGEAIIYEIILQMIKSPQNFQFFQKNKIIYRGYSIDYEIQPSNGLIDINSAPGEMISLLLQSAAGISEDKANSISESIRLEREKLLAKNMIGPWESVDDLVKVPGFEYDLFYKIKGFIFAGRGNNQNINRSSLKPPLSQWVSEGKWSKFISDAGSTEYFNITAKVFPRPGGDYFVIDRRIALNNSSEDLPWIFLSSNDRYQYSPE